METTSKQTAELHEKIQAVAQSAPHFGITSIKVTESKATFKTASVEGVSFDHVDGQRTSDIYLPAEEPHKEGLRAAFDALIPKA